MPNTEAGDLMRPARQGSNSLRDRHPFKSIIFKQDTAPAPQKIGRPRATEKAVRQRRQQATSEYAVAPALFQGAELFPALPYRHSARTPVAATRRSCSFPARSGGRVRVLVDAVDSIWVTSHGIPDFKKCPRPLLPPTPGGKRKPAQKRLGCQLSRTKRDVGPVPGPAHFA